MQNKERQERLRLALRANLRKRKAQSRARQDDERPDDDQGDDQGEKHAGGPDGKHDAGDARNRPLSGDGKPD